MTHIVSHFVFSCYRKRWRKNLKNFKIPIFFKWNSRFCVGDRFYLCDNKILCESDYAERQMSTPSPYENQNYNNGAINNSINSHINSNSNSNSNSTTTITTTNNNNSECSVNRNISKNASNRNNNTMSSYPEKSNNFTNFDVPIHVR